ncbi:hypothetical protein DFO77_103216 [Marinilabilia salmonicolor]|uniref:Uncharacterized protein n=2 Tax=Marinilabilia salmonicolor TaxID=989 RepID=A0A2T0XME7_9BACT|nr:hypothetical protein BY457_107180 [Marinilabilia salmonicolor]RCW38744.1 hypothetical protein DFO77_103216 [Marinilabilia salmonicolor]
MCLMWFNSTFNVKFPRKPTKIAKLLTSLQAETEKKIFVRNYSEIGCLTLLGVTLTVYVAVGACQPHEGWPDSPEKNISAEEVVKALREGNGKHYFVKISKSSVLSGDSKEALPVFSTVNISALSGISVLPEILPDAVLFTLPQRCGSEVWLTDLQDKRYLRQKPETRNSATFPSLEIRAGPSVA